MKLFKLMKDGGPKSKVSGFFLVEIKKLFTIALLKFDDGSREAFHSHAFNSISWLLKGKLQENHLHLLPLEPVVYRPSLKPIMTYRGTFHKVVSSGTTYVLTFRGPWADRWAEYLPEEDRFVTLTHGREEVHG